MRCRDKLHILSERIGLRLYAIADDPIWVDSNGSSSSYVHWSIQIPKLQMFFPGAHLEISQQPNISCDLVCRRAETRQRCQDVDVDLTRIRLGRDGVGVLEPTQFCDAFIQRLYFPVVVIKEGQKTGLSARRAFGTAETDVVPRPFEVPKIPKEFLSRYTSTTFTRYVWYNEENKLGSRV